MGLRLIPGIFCLSFIKILRRYNSNQIILISSKSFMVQILASQPHNYFLIKTFSFSTNFPLIYL
jgi:hypothetical protein